jgi:hypothetical protein
MEYLRQHEHLQTTVAAMSRARLSCEAHDVLYSGAAGSGTWVKQKDDNEETLKIEQLLECAAKITKNGEWK